MHPPAPCRCKSAAGDRIGTFQKKEERSKTRHRARPFVIFVIGERKSGSTRSIARFIRGERPPARAVSRTVLSTRESGTKQIIRGKDASRFRHREKMRELQNLFTTFRYQNFEPISKFSLFLDLRFKIANKNRRSNYNNIKLYK